jgi:hypothetical protein
MDGCDRCKTDEKLFDVFLLHSALFLLPNKSMGVADDGFAGDETKSLCPPRMTFVLPPHLADQNVCSYYI